MRALMFIVLALGAIVLFDEVIEIITHWIEAVRLYRKGWRVK